MICIRVAKNVQPGSCAEPGVERLVGKVRRAHDPELPIVTDPTPSPSTSERGGVDIARLPQRSLLQRRFLDEYLIGIARTEILVGATMPFTVKTSPVFA